MSENLRQSLASQLAADLARAIEAMTSEQPQLSVSASQPEALDQGAVWRQRFSQSSGATWLCASEQAWISLGARALKAAGIEDTDEATSKSTFLEILAQALSMLARSVSGLTKREWDCSEGQEVRFTESPSDWTCVHLTFSDGTSERLFARFDDALIADVGGPAQAPAPVAKALQPASAPAADKSKTLDLLLDVELPVSISFGRAQLPLKDVIKLTTGCIVELNRTITEPVEIIVNNCVIARGEVVVVEGNFGVRIQQVVSREERLRTLY